MAPLPPLTADEPRGGVLPGQPAPPGASAPADAGPEPRRGPSRRVLVWGLVVLLVVAGLAGWRLAAPDGTPPLTTADVDRAVAAAVTKAQQDARAAPPDAALAYRRVAPSLVTVTQGTSSGSGVVIDQRGDVLTALHVVSAATPVRVRFADGTLAAGVVAKRQASQDIAVLAVDRLPGVVVPAVIGGGVQVGDPVFGVGNPLGLAGSLSAGVVSGTGRQVRVDARTTLSGLIQFDAAVNPGSSGGPLLDRAGNVVGIVTGLANPSRQPYFVGIGFAVPIATAGGAAGGPSK